MIKWVCNAYIRFTTRFQLQTLQCQGTHICKVRVYARYAYLYSRYAYLNSRYAYINSRYAFIRFTTRINWQLQTLQRQGTHIFKVRIYIQIFLAPQVLIGNYKNCRQALAKCDASEAELLQKLEVITAENIKCLLLCVTVCYCLLLCVTVCYCLLLSVTVCYCLLLSVTA